MSSFKDLSFVPPNNWDELDTLQSINKLSDEDMLVPSPRKVARFTEGVIVKYGRWDQAMAEEVLCTRFAKEHGLPAPKVLYHPGSAEEMCVLFYSAALSFG
jgi:hypothetical protein